MTKNKAFSVIATFSKAELKDFELFLISPYYNSNKAIIRLYEFFIKQVNKSSNKEISDEEIFQKIFPGKKYNYGIMKNLLSGLFALCEKFLAVNPLEEDHDKEFDESLRRLKNYNIRMLDKLFFAEYKKTAGKMEYSVLSADYYRNRWRLAESIHKYYVRRSNYNKGAETLSPMIVYNTCNIIASVKQNVESADYLERQINSKPEINVAGALYKNLDTEKFLEDIKGLDKEHYDYLLLQAGLIKLYTEPGNMDNYSVMKKHIFESIEGYTNAERWYLSSALFSFILNKYIPESSTALLDELAELRRTQLKYVEFNKGGLGPMQEGVFRNIIELFVVLGDNSYAEEVIEKFIPQLEPAIRKSNRAYAMALIEESKGNNEKVLELIKDVEFSNPQTRYAVKMVALVAYYALGYIEEGLTSCDALKHFIKDTGEFSDAMKHHLLSRSGIIEKLFKIKANPEKYTVADITEFETSNKTHFAARKEWFLAKTAELKTIVGK